MCAKCPQTLQVPPGLVQSWYRAEAPSPKSHRLRRPRCRLSSSGVIPCIAPLGDSSSKSRGLPSYGQSCNQAPGQVACPLENGGTRIKSRSVHFQRPHAFSGGNITPGRWSDTNINYNIEIELQCFRKPPALLLQWAADVFPSKHSEIL